MMMTIHDELNEFVVQTGTAGENILSGGGTIVDLSF